MGKDEERKGSNCINTIILPNILTTLKNQLRKTKYAKTFHSIALVNQNVFLC